ncbi:hypothetical protein TSAR_012207 [Trichomalopsis sarcophagae]|uniref:Ig-like domain-containing protein n=1 Tax=Trichomalopsis sarcophagae TaxID=543379 RepID=A0A232FG20_9HYME|nr:hypothetical protein TSAR_012207 [Trichomalopsis sarcophagae]
MWRNTPVGGGSLRSAILLFISSMFMLGKSTLLSTLTVSAEDETMGPIFVKEPPNRVDFSNGTGAVIECQARGNPQPDIIWIRADGTAVGDVPGLRQVLPNGNLVFPPFRAEDYRQEVHAQVYICLAKNPVGSIHSRDVNVRAVVAQYYDTDVNKEYAIRGNSAVLKCVVPSFVADFVTVLSWHTDQGEEFVRNTDGTEDYVVHQYYQSEVNNEYVIRGNAAILKCSIPSFVAEFVQIVGWQDDQGNSFNMGNESGIVTQYYEAEVVSEYVIRGNAAILKCTIPSFVAEFVSVDTWEGSDGSSYKMSHDYGTHLVTIQPLDAILSLALSLKCAYHPEIMTEYVIRGNSAILKCSIPSYVAEFSYVTEAENEYVIRANSAIMKCKIPSFVSEFIYVDQWVASDGSIYTPGREHAVSQYFEVQVYDVFAIRGNAAIFKCQVPSFVGDYVIVAEWISSNAESFTFDKQSYVVGQRYAVNVMDEHVLRGNAAIIKCHIPSFVAEFVQVDSWLEDDATEIYPGRDYDGKYLVLPSGELHIKDVGPEDGYKTYQCRTKHRLTGETRLSATKGRLVITEPVGSVRPKFPSLDNLRGLVTNVGKSLPLLCPAQAFPVPSYSYFFFMSVSMFVEPVAGVRPKFSTSENSRTYTNRFGEPLTLFCPAQAFPVPVFSYAQWRDDSSMSCPRVSCSDVQVTCYNNKQKLKYGFVYTNIEPASSTRPQLAGSSDLQRFTTAVSKSVTLHCPAQGFPVPLYSIIKNLDVDTAVTPKGFPSRTYAEPASSTRPQLSGGTDFFRFSAAANKSVTVQCPAQGFPVPLYRTSWQCSTKVSDYGNFNTI